MILLSADTGVDVVVAFVVVDDEMMMMMMMMMHPVRGHFTHIGHYHCW